MTDTKEDDFEIYLNLCNLLHWIIMTEEWHKDHNNKGDEYNKNKRKNSMVDLMKGIRFANNSMKHNMIFQRLHIMPTGTPCGSSEAICGAFSCGIGEIIWSPVSGFYSKKPWEIEQYECYNTNLKLKDITNTLEPVVTFLQNETDTYIMKNNY